MLDHYFTLGLRRDAGEREIARAYRRLARRYHPDVSAGPRDTVTLFLAIQTAYETLSDARRRAVYDAELRRSQQAPTVPYTSPPTGAASPSPETPAAATGARGASPEARVASPPQSSGRSTTALATAVAATALLPISLVLADTVYAVPGLVFAAVGSLLALIAGVAARSIVAHESEQLWRRNAKAGAPLGGLHEARQRLGVASRVAVVCQRLVFVGVPILFLLARR